MGSFVFKWDHPATEVYVTGTFDDWKKTEKMEKIGAGFQKQVALPDTSSKIFFKFVVDGDWVIDTTAPMEVDETGIENNVLTPDRIVSEAPATATMLSSAAPESTTAILAADIPLEKKEENGENGVTDVKDEKNEEQHDNLKTGKDELPGTFPETPAAEPKDEVFTVNPLPATAGAMNPIQLAPGEEVPKGLTAESTTSNVKLDPESYEKSDTLPGDAPFITSSAAPESTTAALAANVPLEPKVPAIVKESQEKAHVDPEASAVPSEVEEKAAVEKELLEKVDEVAPTSEGIVDSGADKAEDATSGKAPASIAVAANKTNGAVPVAQTNAPTDTKESIAEAGQSPEAATNTEAAEGVKAADVAANGAPREVVSSDVPAVVQASIAESGNPPEAATNSEAVEEKKAVETELLKEVKPAESADEPSQNDGPATIEAPAATEASENKETPALAVPVTAEALATSVAAAATETPAAEASKPTEQETVTNGSKAGADPTKPAESAETTPSDNKAADSPETAERKKKNRFSTMFEKIRAKLSHKD